jgi:hypothetical protein
MWRETEEEGDKITKRGRRKREKVGGKVGVR